VCSSDLTSGVYVLLAALVAPSLVEAGIEPIAAHLFILYFGMMSMITPPVALAAFAAATITKADPLATGLAAMRMGWAAFIIPFVFVGSSHLLLNGSYLEIALALALSAVGVVTVTAGIVGFWRRHLHVVERIVLIIIGLLAFPSNLLQTIENFHIPAAAVALVYGAFVMWLGRSISNSKIPTQ